MLQLIAAVKLWKLRRRGVCTIIQLTINRIDIYVPTIVYSQLHRHPINERKTRFSCRKFLLKIVQIIIARHMSMWIWVMLSWIWMWLWMWMWMLYVNDLSHLHQFWHWIIVNEMASCLFYTLAYTYANVWVWLLVCGMNVGAGVPNHVWCVLCVFNTWVSRVAVLHCIVWFPIPKSEKKLKVKKQQQPDLLHSTLFLPRFPYLEGIGSTNISDKHTHIWNEI